jgi:hypothetical protein
MQRKKTMKTTNKMKTRQFDHLLAKKRKYQENKPRVSWTATSISSIPQKIKCNRGVPKEIGPKITDFLRDIEPGFYYPVRETLKRNPKSMQTGCRYAGNICTEENGSG